MSSSDLRVQLKSSNSGAASPLLGNHAETGGPPIKKPKVIHNKLTTLNGCYVPCLLNIMGIILFLRLGWAIGEVGVSGLLVIFAIAEVSSMLTILSLSAIVTNGQMQGGGSYFMISRTLGPEFGGSIGILFYFAYAVGTTFYVTGFAEEVRNTFYPDEGPWFIAGVASACLAVVLLVALAGAGWFTKINVFLFVLQFAAILMGLFAMYFREGPINLETNDTVFDGFTFESLGVNWEGTLNVDNEKCQGQCTFALIFATVFPATTGIMEGANLSGDLINPGYSIPVGTITALGTSIVFYFLLIMSYAGSYDRSVLLNNDSVMQETSWWPPLIVTGILVSSASSALGALFGGSRVLQALARDDMFPGLGIFGQGTVVGDEPTYAVLFTWVITQSCCIIFRGSLDAVANFISALFCLSYATVNLSAFLLCVSGTPNFRPAWKFYTWHTCLMGGVLNLAIMFYLNWVFGVVSVAVEILIFVFLVYRAPKMIWGEVTQSVIFHQVRKYLLQLDERKMHSKLWRPSVLLLLVDVDHALIDFCNQLKKGGLYIIGNAVVGDFHDFAPSTQEIKRNWINWIESHMYKAFPQICIGPDLKNCYESLLLLAGLGAMSPNTVVVPMYQYKEPTASPKRRVSVFKNVTESKKLQIVEATRIDPMEWVACLRNVLLTKKNLVVTENFDEFDPELLGSTLLKEQIGVNLNASGASEFTLDVVIQACDYMWKLSNVSDDEEDTQSAIEELDPDQNFPELLLQLSHIVALNKKWQNKTKLRILLIMDDQVDFAAKNILKEFLKRARINVSDIQIIAAPPGPKVDVKDFITVEGEVDQEKSDWYLQYYEHLNKLILEHTSKSLFTFMKLPPLPKLDDHNLDQNTCEHICELYITCLRTVLRNLPPTALCATGEADHVISTQI